MLSAFTTVRVVISLVEIGSAFRHEPIQAT